MHANRRNFRVSFFKRLLGNRGRGTPSGVGDINLPEAIQFYSQDALRMHYRQVTYEVTLIFIRPL